MINISVDWDANPRIIELFEDVSASALFEALDEIQSRLEHMSHEILVKTDDDNNIILYNTQIKTSNKTVDGNIRAVDRYGKPIKAVI